MVRAQMITGEKPESKRRFCGNCFHHNVYEYPDLILCKLHYQSGKDSIVPTLGFCEHWRPTSEECFCVREASKKRDKTVNDKKSS